MKSQTLAKTQKRLLEMGIVVTDILIFLNCLPSQSPAEIMYALKGYTSRILRKEFRALSRMPSLWTRNYFVSTAGKVSNATVKKYIESQKKRY